MNRVSVPSALLLSAVLAIGCEQSPAPTGPGDATAAFGNGNGKGGGGSDDGGSALYQLRFIIEDDSQGEIRSDLFPAGGVKLDTKDPWRNLEVSGATWAFVNYTHGTRGLGTCTVNTDVDVNWVVASNPALSFENTWRGTVSFWRNRGMHFYLEAPAAENGGRAIQNIASNHNDAHETSAADKSWFRIRFANARLGFGGASSPDGTTLLSDLAGYESACANFTVEAVKMP